MSLKNNFTVDSESKSLSFFNKNKENISVSSELIEDIKSLAFRDRINLRVNLHSSSSDTFHNMLIFQWKGTYIRPHKHLHKPETCHMIEGKQQQILLKDNGEIIDRSNLSVNENLIYRIESNTYHTAYILSEYVLFHESKPGPFLFEDDSIFPEWAPNSDQHAAGEYMNRIFDNSI